MAKMLDNSFNCMISGGMADIAAHESCGDGSVESLTSTCGGDWGTIHVDNCFKSYLTLLFGTRSVDDLVKQNVGEWYKLIMDYEASKVSETNGGTLELGLNIPQCLKQSAVDNKGLRGAHELAELIRSPNFGGHFRLIGQRLEIDEEATRGMYSYTVNSVVGKLKELLHEGAVSTQSIDHVIFVGGLSMNESMRTMLQSNLKGQSVTFPSDGEMFATKGAVLHGYNQTLVRSRVVPLTYGIRSTVPYDDSKHAGGETVTLNGVKMCTDNFHVLMKAGTKLNTGYEARELDKPLSADDTEQQFDIYACGAADSIPSLITHYTMYKEASFSVPLPFGCLAEDKMFERAVIFGETDISFRITFQKRTKNVFMRNMKYD